MRYAMLPALFALAACQTAPAPPAETPQQRLAFAQGACGGCHAVTAFALSPNPDSPSFAAIANRPGLTRESLTTWLTDAHNYPEQMEFTLTPADISRLVTHIMALQNPDYRPLD